MGPIDAKSRDLTALEKLELRMLPPEGLLFEEDLPAAWLQKTLGETTDTGQPIEIIGVGKIEIEVSPLGEVDSRPPIRIHGRISGQVRTACVRCLEDVDLGVGDEIETTLFPVAGAPEPVQTAKKKGAPAKDDPKLEDWSSEDMPDLDALDEAGYVGESIDIPAVLEEAIVLSMDLNPVCVDTVACDQRTQAMLDEANRESREAESGPDPRWASLAKLMTPESEDS